jgi:hypothetical protein
MKSQVTSWLMIGAALGLLLIAGRLDIILLAGPVSLLVGLLTMHARRLGQRKILSEK